MQCHKVTMSVIWNILFSLHHIQKCENMDEDSCNGNQNTAPAPKATSHSKHKQHKLMAHTATQT